MNWDQSPCDFHTWRMTQTFTMIRSFSCNTGKLLICYVFYEPEVMIRASNPGLWVQSERCYSYNSSYSIFYTSWSCSVIIVRIGLKENISQSSLYMRTEIWLLFPAVTNWDAVMAFSLMGKTCVPTMTTMPGIVFQTKGHSCNQEFLWPAVHISLHPGR